MNPLIPATVLLLSASAAMADAPCENPVAPVCQKACAVMGAKYVLYDSSTKTVYQLDDQKKPVAFAGDQVKVTGTLNTDTNTIHVISVHKAS